MIEIIEADFSSTEHGEAIVTLLDQYANDQMGGGKALPEYVYQNLILELKKRNGAHALLAYADGNAAGFMICFEGFSTFSCKGLLNIHDLFVTSHYRGKGLSKMLLARAEELAVRLDCCKLTLEVLEGNTIAQQAYRSFGFSDYSLDPKLGRAMFWEKKLTERV